MPNKPRLIYIHDPMCSWCWGFRPVFEQLCLQLDQRLTVERLLGGLARDSDQPMPTEMRNHLQDTWRHIQQRIPGTHFDFAFWTECAPRRSTWPACRAVIAARTLDPSTELAMIEAIQRAYYLEARNPSDDETLIALAGSLGIRTPAFADLLNAGQTQTTLDREMATARAIGATSFPSLRLQRDNDFWPIPIDYTRVEPMLTTLGTLLDDMLA